MAHPPQRWTVTSLSKDLSLDAESAVGHVVAMAAELATRLAEVRDQAVAAGLDPAVVDRLAKLLSGHVGRCRRALESGATA